MKWHTYLQLRGAEARAAGQSRDNHQLTGHETELWTQGYDAMDSTIEQLLNEIRAGWLASGSLSSGESPAATASSTTPGILLSV